MCAEIAAVSVVIDLNWGNLTIDTLFPALQGIWDTIKEKTGFVWDKFKQAVKDPLFWGGLTSVITTAIGAGLSFALANPLIGILVATVGVGVGIGVGVAAVARRE